MTMIGAAAEDPKSAPDVHTPRRYDLDWLRVFAFGVLIFYHIGLFYVSWDWLVNSRYGSPLLEPVLGLITPWRLLLLFFISGVATRFLIDKLALRKFLASRITRLLLPLAFGMVVICAPQTYAALRYTDQIPSGFLAFYRDYLGFGQYAFSLPDWHQLWYVGYLLAYTLITVACLPLLRYATNVLATPFFGWLARGRAWRLLLVPAIPFAACTLLVEIYLPLSDAFEGDWTNFVHMLAIFLVGFMAAKNEDFWIAVDRALPASIGLSLVLGGLQLAAWLNQFAVGADTRLLYGALMLKAFYAWTIAVTLFGLARRFANHSSPALTYLTAAVFPYYILHQTIIVMVGYWFTVHEAPLPIEAGTIVAATLLGCGAGYEIIRRVAVLRPLFGLPLREKQASRPMSPPLEYGAR